MDAGLKPNKIPALNGLENNKGLIFFVLCFSNPDCRFLASASKVSALFFNYHNIPVMSPHVYNKHPQSSSPPLLKQTSTLSYVKGFYLFTPGICQDYEKASYSELYALCFMICEFRVLKTHLRENIS